MAEQQYLPAEYQSGLDEAERLRLLALQLAKSQAPLPQGQMVSGYYIKPNNLQYLSNLIGGQQANSAMVNAQALRQKVLNKYLRDQQRERERVTGMTLPTEQEVMGPPAEGEVMGREMVPPNLLKAAATAQSSPFPEVQALAKTISERNQKLFEEAAKTSTSGSVREGALAGGDPGKLRQNVYGSPQVHQIPGIGAIVTTGDERGNIHQTGIQKPVDTPEAKFGKGIVETRLADLQKVRPDLANHPQMQRDLFDAYRIVKSGLANTGKYADQITGMQAFATHLGLEVPPSVPVTQYLQNVLAPAIAQMLKAIRGVGAQSNAELQVALAMAPNIDKDPRALEAMLIHGIKAIEYARNEYNQQLEALVPSISTYGGDPALATSLRIPGGIGEAGPSTSNMTPEEYNAIFRSTPLGTLMQAPPGVAQKPRKSTPFSP